MSVTSQELQSSVNKGEGNKAPGRDGVGLELFKETSGDLKGDMLEIFTQTSSEENSRNNRNVLLSCAFQKGQGPLTRRTSGQ